MQLIRRVLVNASLAGMVVLSVATGCGGDDDEDVNPGNGGENSGGAAAAGTDHGASAGEPSDAGAGATGGGASSGGTGASPGGAPSAGAPPAEGGASQAGAGSAFGGAPTSGGAEGSAVAKFCNTLGGETTTLRLEIGEGINKLTFTAASGECAPADGQDCTEIPSGQAVVVSLYDAENDALPLHVNPQKISDGQSWVFFVQKKGANVSWSARTIKEGVACEDVTFSDL